MYNIGDDLLDLRDLWKQYEELQATKDSLEEDGELLDFEEDEFKTLKALFDEVGEPYRGGEFDEPTLIHDRYFETYAREFAEEIGAVSGDESWPLTCIDWKEAAEELQVDYSCIEMDGHTYYQRS
jgi:hypothetical protein